MSGRRDGYSRAVQGRRRLSATLGPLVNKCPASFGRSPGLVRTLRPSDPAHMAVKTPAASSARAEAVKRMSTVTARGGVIVHLSVGRGQARLANTYVDYEA